MSEYKNNTPILSHTSFLLVDLIFKCEKDIAIYTESEKVCRSRVCALGFVQSCSCTTATSAMSKTVRTIEKEKTLNYENKEREYENKRFNTN